MSSQGSSRPRRSGPTRGRPRKRPDSSQSDHETEPEPDTKRQKPNELESFEIIDIYARGDLLIIFESYKIAYRIDSTALDRASPALYQKCLAVKPDSSDSTWTFNRIPETEPVPAELVLNLVHSNMDRLPLSLPWFDVHNAVSFAKNCEMLDRYRVTLQQWFRTMEPSKDEKTRNCSRLWLAHTLELKWDFKDLKRWAIYNLCDNGKGELGDPVEEMFGEPLSLYKVPLADKAIADDIARLRCEAVSLILTDLKRLNDTLPGTTKDTPKGDVSIRHPCQLCLDLWSACLLRNLRDPRFMDGPVNITLPSLDPVPLGNDYGRSLEELCGFVCELESTLRYYVPESLHTRAVLEVSGRCSSNDERSKFRSVRSQGCKAPQLVKRQDVEMLVRQGLVDAN